MKPQKCVSTHTLLSTLKKQYGHVERNGHIAFDSPALFEETTQNNYTEAGMHILKELVFSRVKAYDLVQIFHFITETMERYYQSKLLSVAHSRLDRYVSIRYQGLNSKAYKKESISQVSESHYIVPSKEEREVVYHVDVEVGTCTCPHGQDGSPCSHQAAVVLHFGCASVNFIPILNPEGKRSLAIIAYGEDAIQDLMFYSTLSQPKPTATQQQVADSSQPDFSASCWDHFRMGEMNENPAVETLPTQQDQHTQQSELCQRIDVITDDMKKRLMADTIFQQSAEKFVTTYEKLSSKPTSAHITSALHKFGWCYGGTITSQQGGVLRRG